MIYTYPLEDKNIDLSNCIVRHSGDKTFAYKTVDGTPICMSVYYPQNYNQKQRYPAFFFIHGGGWASHKVFDGESGWQGDYLGYLARHYADKGFVSVSIDYRLARDMAQTEGYQLFDLYLDCSEAVNYLLDHEDDYKIDTKQVYILGESAGGHLAGLMATKYKRNGFQFKSAFLVNAITELVEDMEWNKRVPKNPTHEKLMGLSETECAKQLSPLYNICEDNCPVVLIHGCKDHCVNPIHSKSFYERMRGFSQECELHWIEDTDHAFLLAEYTSNLAACKIGIEIIDGYLERVGK